MNLQTLQIRCDSWSIHGKFTVRPAQLSPRPETVPKPHAQNDWPGQRLRTPTLNIPAFDNQVSWNCNAATTDNMRFPFAWSRGKSCFENRAQVGASKAGVHRRGEFSVELSWFCKFVNALTILARHLCSDRHKNTTPHKEKNRT